MEEIERGCVWELSSGIWVSLWFWNGDGARGLLDSNFIESEGG